MLEGIAKFHKHEHKHQHKKMMLRNIIEYLNHLYLIELLRYSNMTRVDLQIAYQFAKYQSAPWVESLDVLMDVYSNDKNNLYKFLFFKICKTIDKLCNDIGTTKSDLYTSVPLTPATANALYAAMQNHFLDSGSLMSFNSELERWCVYSNEMARHGNQIVAVTEDFTAVTDIQVADRILVGVFDNFVKEQPDLSSPEMRERYGAYRKDVRDGRVYVPCLCKWLIKTSEALKRSHMNQLPRCSAWASLFSIVYRLNIPVGMHPDRLECMYEQYILRNHHVAQALNYARQFSTITAEAALGDKLPDLCSELLSAEFKEVRGKNNFFITAVYPNSIVERYLVTQWLLERGDKCLDEMVM